MTDPLPSEKPSNPIAGARTSDADMDRGAVSASGDIVNQDRIISDNSIQVSNLSGIVGLAIGNSASVVINQFSEPSPPVSAVPSVTGALSKAALLTAFRQSGAELRSWRNTVAGQHIERAEVPKIVEWMFHAGQDERLAMLLDQPGGGKTVVMRDVLQRLEDSGLTVLAIKADYLSGIRSRAELADRLDLPATIEECIKQAADEYPVIILVDQLDALSLTLSRDQTTLSILLSTIARLRNVKQVRILASCRTFDLHNDPQLSNLHIDREFRLQPLQEDQVNSVLRLIGVPPEKLLPDHQRLLTVPLHLDVYTRIIATGAVPSESFRTLQDLYQALWQKQIVGTLLGIPRDTVAAIYELVESMQASRQLTAPVAILDPYPEASQYLTEAGFIKLEGHNWLFAHQTLFDYCYARRFVAQRQSLSHVLLESPQGLFERSQMVQILAYLRGADYPAYLHELSPLFFDSPSLRSHLRLLLFNWFGALGDPSAEDLSIAQRLMTKPDDRARFLQAISGNSAWFDLLNGRVLPSILVSSDEVLLDTTTRYLSTLMRLRGEAILERLLPFLEASEVWDARIRYCLLSLDNWQSEKAVSMVCSLLRRDRMGGQEDIVFYPLARSNPAAACKALRVLLDRRLDNLIAQRQSESQTVGAETHREFGHSFAYQDALFSRYGVKETLTHAEHTCPDQIIEHLLPWLIRAAVLFTDRPSTNEDYPSDALFSWGWYGEHIMEGAFFGLQMARAVQHLAKERPAEFRGIVARLISVDSLTVQRLLVYGYLADPQTYAEDIFGYLMADQRRLSIGESLESPHYDSVRLFSVAFRYGDASHRLALEQLILNYRPTWEKRTLKMQGITQLRFLKGVPAELLSDPTRRFRQELELKFPGLEVTSPRGVDFGRVGSPIDDVARDKMSDEAWLGAMRKYDESTDWGAPREDFLKGGIVELSRAFQEHVKAEPDRFYRLALRFDDSIPAYYIAAAILGLAESNVPAADVFTLIRHHEPRLSGEHRRSVIHALDKRAKENVPDDLLKLLEDWALHDPDPSQELWRTPAPGSQQPYYGGDPYSHGINTNRGAAVDTLSRCLLLCEPSQGERLLTVLEQAAHDASMAVGTCIVENLRYVLTFDRARALAAFHTVMKLHPDMIHFQPAQRFLHAIHRQEFPQIRAYLERMLAADDAQTRQYGAVLACLAAFANSDALPLVETVLAGDPVLRQGGARAYAANLGQIDLADECLSHLPALIIDADEDVRKEAGQCFAHAEASQIEQLKPLIRLYIQSPALQSNPENLIEFLGPIVANEPELGLDVTEATLAALGSQAINYQTPIAMIERHLVQLPLNIYLHAIDEAVKSRAMDLFEQLLLMGSHSAFEALQEYDRR